MNGIKIEGEVCCLLVLPQRDMPMSLDKVLLSSAFQWEV